MRETSEVVHGNTTRYKRNPMTPVSPEEGFKKKRSHPVASGSGKLWVSSEIGDIVFSGRMVIGGGVADEGNIVLPWKRMRARLRERRG